MRVGVATIVEMGSADASTLPGSIRWVPKHDQTNIAVVADSVLARLCRIVGGAFGRHLPLGFRFEDVRALGFPRPPWGLAYDSLFACTWTEGAAGFF
jgi:hypothetical protein